jgi:hypothetical protein
VRLAAISRLFPEDMARPVAAIGEMPGEMCVRRREAA